MNFKKFKGSVSCACIETADSLHKDILKAIKKRKIRKVKAEDLLQWLKEAKNTESLSLAVAAVCNLENLRKEVKS